MKEYKDNVNAQHAPSELVERTIQRMHEEEQTTDVVWHKRKSTNKVTSMVALVACLAACLIVYLGIAGMPRFSYTEVSDVMYRDRLPGTNMVEWDLEKYETYLGEKLIQMPEKYKMVTSKIYVNYDEESRDVLADEGTFYLEHDGSIVILKTSKSGLEIPQELLSGVETDINGTMVYAGEDVTNHQLVAAFWQGDVEYYLICHNMSKRQFEIILKSML